jgi:hypothetical protein
VREVSEREYRPYARDDLRLIRDSICDVLPQQSRTSRSSSPTADEQELIPTGPASEILRKCNPIFIDSSDESALLSGLRVVGPSFA